jgi:hypothetical protein
MENTSSTFLEPPFLRLPLEGGVLGVIVWRLEALGRAGCLEFGELCKEGTEGSESSILPLSDY